LELPVLKVIDSVPVGLKVELPLAVRSPVTVKALLTVVVPLDAPREIAVAAPPMFKVVAVVLKRLAVAAVVVREPPLRARLPLEVMLPVRVEVPLIVRLPFAWISPVLSRVVPDDPYPPPVVNEEKFAEALVALMAVALGSESVVLLMVAVPEFLPMLTVDAAPPMLRVVAVVLKRLAVPAVVVREPPLSAILPAVVTLPELSTMKLVELIRSVKLVPEKSIPLAMVPERVIPLVSVPADCSTWIPLVVVPPLPFILTKNPLVDVPEVRA